MELTSSPLNDILIASSMYQFRFQWTLCTAVWKPLRLIRPFIICIRTMFRVLLSWQYYFYYIAFFSQNILPLYGIGVYNFSRIHKSFQRYKIRKRFRVVLLRDAWREISSIKSVNLILFNFSFTIYFFSLRYTYGVSS